MFTFQQRTEMVCRHPGRPSSCSSPCDPEFTLSKECASTCTPSPRDFCECLALDLPCIISTERISRAGPRFLVSCLSRSVCTTFPHACLSRRVVTGWDNSPTFHLNMNLSCSALCIFLVKFHATLQSQSSCMVLFLKTRRAKISLMKFTFLPFFFAGCVGMCLAKVARAAKLRDASAEWRICAFRNVRQDLDWKGMSKWAGKNSNHQWSTS